MKLNPKIVNNLKEFAETYAKSTSTYFCQNVNITGSVILGLAQNKQIYGAPLCPCRCYNNKEDEISLAYWNCPCIPMRERKECHCMLFLEKNNDFASSSQEISKNMLLG